jgi:hypothetical protein
MATPYKFIAGSRTYCQLQWRERANLLAYLIDTNRIEPGDDAPERFSVFLRHSKYDASRDHITIFADGGFRHYATFSCRAGGQCVEIFELAGFCSADFLL